MGSVLSSLGLGSTQSSGLSPSSTEETGHKAPLGQDIHTEEELKNSIAEEKPLEEPESNDTSYGVEATAVRTLAASTGTVAILGTTAKVKELNEQPLADNRHSPTEPTLNNKEVTSKVLPQKDNTDVVGFSANNEEPIEDSVDPLKQRFENPPKDAVLETKELSSLTEEGKKGDSQKSGTKQECVEEKEREGVENKAEIEVKEENLVENGKEIEDEDVVNDQNVVEKGEEIENKAKGGNKEEGVVEKRKDVVEFKAEYKIKGENEMDKWEKEEDKEEVGINQENQLENSKGNEVDKTKENDERKVEDSKGSDKKDEVINKYGKDDQSQTSVPDKLVTLEKAIDLEESINLDPTSVVIGIGKEPVRIVDVQEKKDRTHEPKIVEEMSVKKEENLNKTSVAGDIAAKKEDGLETFLSNNQKEQEKTDESLKQMETSNEELNKNTPESEPVSPETSKTEEDNEISSEQLKTNSLSDMSLSENLNSDGEETAREAAKALELKEMVASLSATANTIALNHEMNENLYSSKDVCSVETEVSPSALVQGEPKPEKAASTSIAIEKNPEENDKSFETLQAISGNSSEKDPSTFSIPETSEETVSSPEISQREKESSKQKQEYVGNSDTLNINLAENDIQEKENDEEEANVSNTGESKQDPETKSNAALEGTTLQNQEIKIQQEEIKTQESVSESKGIEEKADVDKISRPEANEADLKYDEKIVAETINLEQNKDKEQIEKDIKTKLKENSCDEDLKSTDHKNVKQKLEAENRATEKPEVNATVNAAAIAQSGFREEQAIDQPGAYEKKPKLNEEIKLESDEEIKLKLNEGSKPESDVEIKTNPYEEVQSKSDAGIKPKPDGMKPKADEEIKVNSGEEIKPRSDEEIKPKVSEEVKPESHDVTKPKADEEMKPKSEEEAKSNPDEDLKPKSEEEAKLKPDEKIKPKSDDEEKLLNGTNSTASEMFEEEEQVEKSESSISETGDGEGKNVPESLIKIAQAEVDKICKEAEKATESLMAPTMGKDSSGIDAQDEDFPAPPDELLNSESQNEEMKEDQSSSGSHSTEPTMPLGNNHTEGDSSKTEDTTAPSLAESELPKSTGQSPSLKNDDFRQESSVTENINTEITMQRDSTEGELTMEEDSTKEDDVLASTRSDFVSKTEGEESLTPEEEKAATVIQAGYRGFKTRKRLREGSHSGTFERQDIKFEPSSMKSSLKDEVDPESSNSLSDEKSEKELNDSAKKIQAGVRGYLVRRKQKVERDAAVTIQSHFRGFKTRQRLKQKST